LRIVKLRSRRAWRRLNDKNGVWPLFGRFGDRLESSAPSGPPSYSPLSQLAASCRWTNVCRCSSATRHPVLTHPEGPHPIAFDRGRTNAMMFYHRERAFYTRRVEILCALSFQCPFWYRQPTSFPKPSYNTSPCPRYRLTPAPMLTRMIGGYVAHACDCIGPDASEWMRAAIMQPADNGGCER
jgi:hypothetical protein